MNTWLNRGIGWVRVTCLSLSLVLLSGCGDSGLSSELDTMQRALWQASGAVRDDRGGTLLHAMEDRNDRIGLATLCVGVGQGLAMIIER